MKPKTKPGSKIPTTQTNTNKKKGSDYTQDAKGFNTSLIKKNEFALIVAGALALTVIVFFVFFRSSSSKAPEAKISTNASSYTELEKRIQTLESALETTDMPLNKENGKIEKNFDKIDLLAQRVARLEAAFSVKFDSVIERMAGMEKNIAELKTKQETVLAKKSAATTAVKAPVQKTSAPPQKKAVKKAVKKSSMFHTVLKGETLYSISKKYNTTVPALRKLNNLSATAKIYPGNNILVR